MTDNIRVIYTPNVEKFFRIHYGMAETPDIPLFAANKMGLRENIDGLKSAHTWLPANVGVVTYHYLIKAFQDGSRQRRAESEYYPGVSYFANLDAMEAIKRILDTEPKTRIEKEHAYRTITYIVYLANTEVKLVRGELMAFYSISPELDEVGKIIEKIEEKGCQLDLEKINGVLRTLKRYLLIDGGIARVKEKFDRNMAPRDYPVYSCSGLGPAWILTGKLDETVAELPELTETLSKRFGIELEPCMDKFRMTDIGKTTPTDSLEILLSKISNPRTIITDIHLVDQFPQLKGCIDVSFYPEIN
jgi:hypothetical protein